MGSVADLDKYKGSLDYGEFIVDPKNKDSTPAQIGEVVASLLELLDEDGQTTLRTIMLDGMCLVRRVAMEWKKEEKCGLRQKRKR